jgi:hypothetical protein
MGSVERIVELFGAEADEALEAKRHPRAAERLRARRLKAQADTAKQTARRASRRAEAAKATGAAKAAKKAGE